MDGLARIAGPLQAALGLLTAASAGTAATLGAGSGASAFNVVSGVVLSLLGFRATDSARRTGCQAVGGVNLLVGVLGLLGIDRVAGVPMNATIVGNVINVGIGIWGLVAGFMDRK